MFSTRTPTAIETWTIEPNNRIVYSSLNQVMSEFLYGIKAFLVAHGYIVKGSCDGTSASMSGVDYWTSASACTTRGANATSAQSWLVLTDGNGVDILFTYQGTVDNGSKISFSIGSLFILAATTTHQPTATDETTLASASRDFILTTTSADRIWHGWVNSDATMFRIVCCRQNVATIAFGIEKFVPMYDPSLLVSKCWGFLYSGTQLLASSAQGVAALSGLADTRGGILRYNNSTNVLVGTGLTIGCGGNGTTVFGVEKPDAQGAGSHIICGMLIAGSAAAFQGVIGLRIDWWYTFTNSNMSLGDFNGMAEWVGLSPGLATSNGGVLWPWDGSSYFLSA